MTGAVPTAGPPPGPGQSVVTMGQFFATLRRQLALVLVLTLLGVALATALFFTTPKTYQATAVVDVSPTSGGSASSVSTITESRIVTSTSVVEAAQQTLGYAGSLSALADQVTVTSPLDSQVLNITFAAATAQGAAAGANAFAHAYLDYRTQIAQQDTARRVGRVQSQIADLQKKLAALSQNDTQRGSLQNQIQQLQNQLNAYQTSVVNPGQLAGEAVQPSAPSSPKKLLYLAGGLLIGLLAGVITAVLRDRRYDRVRTAAELQHNLGAPVIVEFGVTEGGSRPGLLAATAATRGAEADGYRTLSTAVTAHSPTSRVVLLCGTSKDGDSLAPLNLAATFAQQGLQTVLVGPEQAVRPATELLDMPALPAPSGAPLADQLVEVRELPALRVLSLGDEVTLGATLRAAGDTLDDILGTADIVVLDGINVELPSSSVRLGQVADEAVVVAYRNRSTHAALERLGRQLAQVGVPVLGGALLTRRNRLRRRDGESGGGQHGAGRGDQPSGSYFESRSIRSAEADLPSEYEPAGPDPAEAGLPPYDPGYGPVTENSPGAGSSAAQGSTPAYSALRPSGSLARGARSGSSRSRSASGRRR
ncbi:Wzz/FepE/Etk N-terminal domain-containing protein [Jatrophihabitans sp.]|uniref:Wzz/FepE/Etk N-terminal domain-containing protein n=1 Tax=Jatrophihabitans sp. TaxID=1932789 RepID=UPI002C11B1A2|nr:Wzz/FepE/Etk N-terminal domain-containing protein [Jatrophihabitans sp.]